MMRQWWVEYQFSEHAFEDRRNFMYTRFKNFKLMIFGCPQIIKTVEFKKKKTTIVFQSTKDDINLSPSPKKIIHCKYILH